MPLGDKVYVELVRSLYLAVTPSVIMSVAFAVSSLLIYADSGGPFILATSIAGIFFCIARLSVVVWFRREALTAALDRARARRLELVFAVPYLAFAVSLGVFGVAVFRLPSAEAHMLTICLLIGYCAGVATGVGLRPNVAIPSMLVALIPAALTAVTRYEPIYLCLAGVSLALLFGGVQTVANRSATVGAEIVKRLTFGSLALSDGLTALPNRLALREYFEENVDLLPAQRLIAVHFIDLDDFKPVNDLFGHAVGDLLLGAVGERLTNAVRSGDIVARLGGDEFAVLQLGITHAQQAEFLSQRILTTIRQPFRIDENDIKISASIGTITTDDRSLSLDELLRQADEKLYAAKRGKGSARRAVA